MLGRGGGTGRTGLPEVLRVQQDQPGHRPAHDLQLARRASLRDPPAIRLLHRYCNGQLRTRIQSDLHQQVPRDARWALFWQGTPYITKVLETCAGSNRNLRYFKPGVDLTLIDYSPNMMSIGSSKTSPVVKYRYLVGDVMAMPFPDDQFDCVIDTFGLEYTLNPHRAL